MHIAVISTPSYADAWRPFATLFAKFWPDCDYPRSLISVKPDDPTLVMPGFSPIWVERSQWIQELLAGLQRIDDETVLLFQEDFFLSYPVHHDLVGWCDNWLRVSDYHSLRLFPCPGAEGDLLGAGIGEVPSDSLYHISCQAAIWKRAYLIRLLSDMLAATLTHVNHFESLKGQSCGRDLKIASWFREGHPSSWPVSYQCSAIANGRWMQGAVALCKSLDIPLSNRPVVYANDAEAALLRGDYEAWLKSCPTSVFLPELSIVTGTRHRAASCRRFVDSVIATATVPTEIVILDASDEQTYSLDLPSTDLVKIRVLHEKPRLGPNLGYNVGFRNTNKASRYVMFANDDCEMVPGWDRIAIDFMDRHREVGLGALYFSQDGTDKFYTQQFQNLTYANIGIYRREVGEQVGWFDDRSVFVPETGKRERITMYGNDTAASFKVIDAGYAVVPIQGTKVIHHREQDDERQKNYAENLKSNRLPGQIIWQLWNGDMARQATEGYEYGYRQLREKHSRFKHLKQDVYYSP